MKINLNFMILYERTLPSQMSPSINLETTYYIKTIIFVKGISSIEKFKGYKNL